MTEGLRVRLHATDRVRSAGLAAMLAAAGHTVTDDLPDVVLCDLADGVTPPPEAEAPVVLLTDRPPPEPQPAGVLGRDVGGGQLDLALRAVVGGLLVRSPDIAAREAGFRDGWDDTPLLTPRETEILTLVGQGMSNKAIARRLDISVHTVKFHLEALFTKLAVNSRAEAVAKGLRGGAIEL